MNNCIIQGKIVSIGEVKFDYYLKLQAVLVIMIDTGFDNIIEVRVYNRDIDIFLDKYILGDICVICGYMKKNNSYNSFDYVKLREIY